MEKIIFNTDDGEESFFILEETRVNGFNYILVAEDENPESECYIMKDLSSEGEKEAIYEFVDDDMELEAIGKIFTELLETEE